jgi:hypothetical protein
MGMKLDTGEVVTPSKLENWQKLEINVFSSGESIVKYLSVHPLLVH